MEIWKDIEGYEGLYQASSKGLIRSLRFNKEKVLTGSIGNHGYLIVNLYKDKKRKCYTVHQLIAMVFMNHKPNGHSLVIDHIDNNKLNNKVSNLQITTNRYNSSKDRVGSSKFTGVYWNKSEKKWKASIVINGKLLHLGYYKCELAAAKTYNDKLKEIEQ